VLPLALGAAVSPALLTLQVLVLTGRTAPRRRAWAVVVGAVAVVLVYMVLAFTLLSRLSDHGSGHPSSAEAWGKIVCGVLLLLLAVRELLPARTPGERATRRGAARAERLKHAGPGVFVGIGALGMVTNVSTLVLFFPAVHRSRSRRTSSPSRPPSRDSSCS
jgi:threonine/homoserine/homoserine lactone efflux protein